MSYNLYRIKIFNMETNAERHVHLYAGSKSKVMQKAMKIVKLNEHEIIVEAKPSQSLPRYKNAAP